LSQREHPWTESLLVPRGQGEHEDDPQSETVSVWHASQTELEPLANVPFGHFIGCVDSQEKPAGHGRHPELFIDIDMYRPGGQTAQLEAACLDQEPEGHKIQID